MSRSRGARTAQCRTLGAALLIVSALPLAAQGQESAPTDAGVTEALIRMLQSRNALSAEEAQQLLEQLRKEAAAKPAEPAEPKGRIRVPYLPESEKQRIREQVKKDVLDTAKAENWAAPNAIPDWTRKISLAGDFRLRQEFDFLDRNNNPFFINFQAINSGSPYNVGTPTSNQVSPPLLNSTQNRQAQRVRARLELNAKLNDSWSTGFRLSSGNLNNPVSTNQSLGNDFNKLSLVLDRAYLQYKPTQGWARGLQAQGGRMPNPFVSTELVWDEDVNLDGLALSYKLPDAEVLKPYLTAGGFAIQNTAFDFPSTSSNKSVSHDSWLFAAQLGTDWNFIDDMQAGAALAYYHYQGISGELSQPCLAPTTAFSCNTDDTRPAFVQKGNTLFALRQLQLASANDPQYQYFGLASPFRVLNARLLWDWSLSRGNHLNFTADYARNLAYDRRKAFARTPVNNYEPGIDTNNDGVEDVQGAYKGGADAYLAQLRYGQQTTRLFGDWNVYGGYRWIESDAVVDAFTDSDFHLGGTNAKGIYLGANAGVGKNVWLSLHYFSATEISGPPLAIDVLQLDINARF